MAIARKVVEIIADEAFLEEVRSRSARLLAGLEKVVVAYGDVFAEVRGQGFLLGLRCAVPVELAVTAARANALLSVTAGDNVLRLLPPLILSDAEIDEGLARLQTVGRALTLGGRDSSVEGREHV